MILFAMSYVSQSSVDAESRNSCKCGAEVSTYMSGAPGDESWPGPVSLWTFIVSPARHILLPWGRGCSDLILVSAICWSRQECRVILDLSRITNKKHFISLELKLLEVESVGANKSELNEWIKFKSIKSTKSPSILFHYTLLCNYND